MNKLYIAGAIALASIAWATAQDNKARPMPASSQVMRQAAPRLMTGDTTTDAQIQALNTEMQTKIKGIQDEYITKIKAIVGTRIPQMATGTPREMKMDDSNKMPRPMMASGTPQILLRAESPNGNAIGARLKNFFRGILGGN